MADVFRRRRRRPAPPPPSPASPAPPGKSPHEAVPEPEPPGAEALPPLLERWAAAVPDESAALAGAVRGPAVAELVARLAQTPSAFLDGPLDLPALVADVLGDEVVPTARAVAEAPRPAAASAALAVWLYASEALLGPLSVPLRRDRLERVLAAFGYRLAASTAPADAVGDPDRREEAARTLLRFAGQLPSGEDPATSESLFARYDGLRRSAALASAMAEVRHREAVLRRLADARARRRRPGMCPSDPDPRLALPEYEPFADVALEDADRWPARSAAGAARLAAVRDRPDAPRWTHRTGDRLDAAALARVRAPLPLEGWLEEHLAVARRLPAYRRRAASLRTLEDFPTVSRADLVADVSRFVPLDADLDRAVAGTSSGSTGAALTVPDDPEELARGLLHLVDLVRAAGPDLAPEGGRTAVAHLVAQRSAFTYASTLTAFGEAPMVRVNLSPHDWARGAADRDGFLAALDPQVLTGAPVALEAALPLAGRLRPLAVVSSATALAPALREALEEGFGCPVLDLYGLHETRSIAVRPDDGPFRVLRRRVLVEVLDPSGAAVPPGERGEVVVTAGENPFLPLVRYRTGDTGRLVAVDGRPALADLEGRATVRFLAADGAPVPSVDLTQQLQAAGATGWRVEQAADRSVTGVLAGGDARRARDALEALLGVPVRVASVDRLADLGDGKPRRYASEAR